MGGPAATSGGARVAAARKMIKGATVEKYHPQEHDQTFWCLCCAEEVKKHTSDGSLTVLFGGMLEHLWRPEHVRAVHRYWWTHQGEVKLKAQFILTGAEYERFKTSVTKALESYEETEDTLIKQMASEIREAEQSRIHMLMTALEPETRLTAEEDDTWNYNEPLPCSAMSPVDFEVPGPSNQQFLPNEATVMAGNSQLTFLGQQVISDRGNVHTEEKMALKKLPPNRVGANFDHHAQTDEGWLPSFGRVWNSGRRWQSRHQYRTEAGNKGAKRKRTEQA
ncbi:unnamed protein product [Ranitomeya imitator]|uniref:Coiled-coil domain-containing protein 84 n=1 Tax=Ranitomeya imitator TaxID=111125 RepID=A0ABN9LXI3_9NEOB|nr:unnamed protein product [Ranitomeya imitator]